MSEDTPERKRRTPTERAARKAAKQIEAEQAMADHQKAQKALHDNRDRLRASRLAREAASADEGTNSVEKRKT